MNIKALDKLEKGYIKWDWKEYIHKANLSSLDFDKILDIINNFKSNRSAKELALFKLKNSSFYITVKRSEYSDLLKWLNNKFLDNEMYEHCSKIQNIQSKLK